MRWPEIQRVQLGRSAWLWVVCGKLWLGGGGVDADAEPVGGRDGERAVDRSLIRGREAVRPLGRVLHALAVRRVDACGCLCQHGRVGGNRLNHLHARRRLLAFALLVRVHVHARSGDGLRHRHHRTLPELLLALGFAPRRLVVRRLHNHLFGREVALRLALRLERVHLALLRLDVQPAHHRLLGPTETLERLQVLRAGQMRVVHGLLCKALAAWYTEGPDGHDQLAALALLMLHFGSVFSSVAMPVRRTSIGPSLLRAGHDLPTLCPVRLVAIAATTKQPQRDTNHRSI
mmetsp:Transcript_45312/g.98589  ORF Transcript_45312/g.98589 Transcript_45312/m.98589 type:complete len:289 (-) Transcript_45312:276-1142(-)